MKAWYKILNPVIIENNSGTYECYIEKHFCNSEYYFRAKQISVKFNNEHYYVEPKLLYFKYIETNQPFTQRSRVNEFETRLNIFSGYHFGKINMLKRIFHRFCEDIKLNAKNEIRKVS